MSILKRLWKIICFAEAYRGYVKMLEASLITGDEWGKNHALTKLEELTRI